MIVFRCFARSPSSRIVSYFHMSGFLLIREDTWRA